MSQTDDADAGHRWIPWFRTRVERELSAELGMHALFCAGQEGLQAVRIAVSADPRRQLSLMQVDAWRELTLVDLVWCPDRDLALRVKTEACAVLDQAARRLRGDWFDCPHGLAVQVVRLAASRAGVPVLTHAGMMARVRSLRERRIERAVRGA